MDGLNLALRFMFAAVVICAAALFLIGFHSLFTWPQDVWNIRLLLSLGWFCWGLSMLWHLLLDTTATDEIEKLRGSVDYWRDAAMSGDGYRQEAAITEAKQLRHKGVWTIIPTTGAKDE